LGKGPTAVLGCDGAGASEISAKTNSSELLVDDQFVCETTLVNAIPPKRNKTVDKNICVLEFLANIKAPIQNTLYWFVFTSFGYHQMKFFWHKMKHFDSFTYYFLKYQAFKLFFIIIFLTFFIKILLTDWSVI
jgi:hypothetical protein